jgi:hypothetical protein
VGRPEQTDTFLSALAKVAWGLRTKLSSFGLLPCEGHTFPVFIIHSCSFFWKLLSSVLHASL